MSVARNAVTVSEYAAIFSHAEVLIETENVYIWQVNMVRPVWVDIHSLQEDLDHQPPLKEEKRKGLVCLYNIYIYNLYKYMSDKIYLHTISIHRYVNISVI